VTRSFTHFAPHCNRGTRIERIEQRMVGKFGKNLIADMNIQVRIYVPQTQWQANIADATVSSTCYRAPQQQ